MGARLSQALIAGRVELPTCQRCLAVQYPPSEICRHCLCDTLEATACDCGGRVIACALVHNSLALDFDAPSAWPIASVKMNAGPIVFAHALGFLERGTAVTLVQLIDSIGDGVFGALANVDDRNLLQAKFNRKI